MSSKTKIFVFKMRELIYTAIFVALAVLLIILLVFMFLPRKEETASSSGTYIPGIYTSSIHLNNQTFDVEVAVDKDHINSVHFVNLDDSVSTMYPLMETAMNDIKQQVVENQSTELVSYTTDTQYTSTLLLDAIAEALNHAKLQPTPDS